MRKIYFQLSETVPANQSKRIVHVLMFLATVLFASMTPAKLFARGATIGYRGHGTYTAGRAMGFNSNPEPAIVFSAAPNTSRSKLGLTIVSSLTNTGSNPFLSHITISSGTLTPVSGTPNYTVNVTNATTTVTVTPTTADPNATVNVNGTAVTSGTASTAIPLIVGSNTINIVVTAQDGVTTQPYVITVTRAKSSDIYLSHLVVSSGKLKAVTGTPNYTVSVASTIASVTVRAITEEPNATLTINGTSVESGTTSSPIPLSIGANTITIVVTAQDGVSTQAYLLTVGRGSNDAYLSHISISSGTLTPISGTPNYTVDVTNATTSVTVTPTTADPNATVTVNGTPVTSGTASAGIPLAVGSNTINIMETAQDGITTQSNIITVTRAKSSDIYLSHLVVSSGKLKPVTGTPNYTVSVTNTITSVTVRAITEDPNATVTINGAAVASGTASAAIPLSAGANTITIVVTAQNGISTQAYILTVGRGASNPYLSHISISSGTLTPVSGTPNYSVSVTNSITSVTITPTTTDPNATVTVNGTAVASGTASAAIPLVVGGNTINILATAQDGVTTQAYIITVTRAKSSNAYLSHLSISSGTLAPVSGTPNYTVNVANAITSVAVTPTATDATATLTVNGTAVTSGTASAAIPLAIGSNTINILATAQDGVTTQLYVITVTRAKSSNAYLSHLSISSGRLTPVTGTPNYTAGVTSATISVKITATTADPTATLTINGTAVISGTASAAIPLSTGTNTITIVVTAQDGTTVQPYLITVNKPSSNIYLSDLSISSGTLTPVSGSPNFTVSVANATTSVTVTPTTVDPNAALTVNGTSLASGTASAAIPLAVGSNTITIVVTAQDGVTTQAYLITVTRASGPLMNLHVSTQQVSVTKPAGNVAIENDGVMVHQGVSPNGDGINDVLTIDGITAYPDNYLTIVDRNGSVIFQSKGYDNSVKAFDGHSNINGRLLQTGTYFYSLDYVADGQNKHKTGYIILRY